MTNGEEPAALAGRRPRVLCISFSDINADSRVLRQLAVLTETHDVTTLCYGSRPEHAADHIEIDRDLPSLPQTLAGVMKLGLRRFRSVQLDAPAARAALDLLGDRQFDIVVANEARALPLAFRVAGCPRIWCDLHEWAPEERTHAPQASTRCSVLHAVDLRGVSASGRCRHDDQ